MIKRFNDKPVTLTKNDKTLLWFSVDVMAKKDEKSYAREAYSLFNEEAESVIGILRQPTKNLEFIDAALNRILSNYTPGAKYHNGWLNRFFNLILTSMQKSGRGFTQTVGVKFDINNPAVIAEAKARATELANYVSKATADRITKVIVDGRQNGSSISEIADELQEKVFGINSRERAIKIARTETIGAFNAGETVTAKSTGFTIKTWLTQGDSRVRDSHEMLDDVSININDTFANGCKYPGDKAGGADEVINCRCTLLYSREGMDGEQQ